MNSSIVLREHREGDAEASYAAVRESVGELSRWMPWCHPGYSLQDASDWVSGAATRFMAAYPYLGIADIHAALAYAAWRSEEIDVPLS